MLAKRLALFAIVSLCGCQVGKDSVLFATKTSLGVDLDAKPPTFDLGYGRKEGSLAPVVKSGEVLPLFMASFHAQTGLLNALFGFGISQSFAVGNSALILSKYLTKPENPADGIDLQHLIKDPGASAIQGTITDSRRYFFGTDTVFGFKVNFPAAGMPDSVALGWRRKEFAYVPIQQVEQYPRLADGSYVQRDGVIVDRNTFERKTEAERAALFDKTTHLVLPSLLATAGASGEAGQGNVKAGVSQIYGTGQAAVYLAANPQVRKTLGISILADEKLSEAVLQEMAFEKAKQKGKADRNRAAELKTLAIAYVSKFDGAKLDRVRSGMIFLRLLDGDETGLDEPTWTPANADTRRAALMRLDGSYFDAGSDLQPMETLVQEMAKIDKE